MPANAPAPTPRTFLPGIEAARGLAALCVAAHHAIRSYPLADPLRAAQDQDGLWQAAGRVLAALCNGTAAVAFFFLISGLVLGMSLDRRPAASPGGYGRFLGRRAFRIYPAHLAFILLIVATAPLLFPLAAPVPTLPELPADVRGWIGQGASFHAGSPARLALNLVLWNWTINPVSWSLYVEMIAAFLLPLFHFCSRRRDRRLDLAMTAFLLVLALAVHKPTTASLFLFYLGLTVFTAGKGWARGIAGRIGSPAALCLGLAAMTLPSAFLTHRGGPVIVLEALGGFTVLSLLVWDCPAGTAAFLARPALHWLGRVSFSFYLAHFFILCALVRAGDAWVSAEGLRAHPFPACAAAFLASLPPTCLAAELGYRWIEQPMIALGRRLLG